ncbi:MAG: Rieske 2Fe-2S domain-containing protein [Kouleothrix sp.]
MHGGQPAPNADGVVNTANLIAIYQVCTHLGCLVLYIVSAKGWLLGLCHGSTFERNSQYVRGPAPRNLDQFSRLRL